MRYVVLVTAKSGDKYAIGPFNKMKDAEAVGQFLEFVKDWCVIPIVRDHMIKGQR